MARCQRESFAYLACLCRRSQSAVKARQFEKACRFCEARAQRRCKRGYRLKSFLQECRFDGADIAHILQSCAEKLDWPHLVRRFGPDWRVLLSHLVLFGYIYPGERDKIPAAIMDDLIARLGMEKGTAGADHICRGTLLSRKQYLLDIQKRGFRDARLQQRVHMNAKDIAHWKKAIAKEEKVRGKPA